MLGLRDLKCTKKVYLMAIRNQYAKFAHSMCLSLSHNMHSRTFTVLLPVAQSRKYEKKNHYSHLDRLLLPKDLLPGV